MVQNRYNIVVLSSVPVIISRMIVIFYIPLYLSIVKTIVFTAMSTTVGESCIEHIERGTLLTA